MKRKINEMVEEKNKFIRGLINFGKYFFIKPENLVGKTPADVIMRENKTRLLRYKGGEKKFSIPLLLIPSMVNRFYIFDLTEKNSIVRAFLRKGFDVFLLEWGTPSREDKTIKIEDIISGTIRRVIKKILLTTGEEKISILGYCMGGTLALLCALIFSENVKNLILLATPLNFGKGGKLTLWADKKYFDVDKFINAYGNAPHKILHTAFGLLKPAWVIKQWKTFFSFLWNEEFLKNFKAVSRWVNDNVDIPGDVFRSYVKDYYQENNLMKNLVMVGEKKVEIKNIKVSLLSILAKYDDIVPPEASVVDEIFKNFTDAKSLIFDCAHVSLTIGHEAHTIIWPKVIDWLGARS